MTESSTSYIYPFLISFLLFTGIGLAATNSDAESTFVGRNVGPHPYLPDSSSPEYSTDPLWPEAVWPSNVWWVPLERGMNQTDVVQAIITPVNTPDGRGYEITVGTLRQEMTKDEFRLASAVGKLVYKPDFGMQWSCTATHVGNGYVVTAGHCVADPKLTKDACSALEVEWDVRKSRREFPKIQTAKTLVGQCQEIISWDYTVGSPTTIDHAIFRVDQFPEAKVDIDSKPVLKKGNLMHQFSHPGGVPLVWTDKCQITGLPFQYFQHDCWGASGSSGSALIDAKTLKLVGVLSMGLDSTYFSVRNDKSPIGCFDVNTGIVTPDCNQN